jgi:hypothetical protein
MVLKHINDFKEVRDETNRSLFSQENVELKSSGYIYKKNGSKGQFTLSDKIISDNDYVLHAQGHFHKTIEKIGYFLLI